MPKITYDIQDLYNFIDTHAEVAVLALEPASGTYAPYNKEWVKKKVYQHLKRQARCGLGAPGSAQGRG